MITSLSKDIKENLCSFHVITGCHCTSQFTGQSKRSSWKVYVKHPQLVSGIRTKELEEKAFTDTETFVSMLYSGNKVVWV